MRTYTVQQPFYPGPAVVLLDGFSWGAFFFGPLWFLFHGLWVSAIVLALLYLAVSVVVAGLALPAMVSVVAYVTISFLLGFNARDWWRMMLERQGYQFEGVVQARSQERAEWTLMQRAFSESRTA